MDPVPARFQRPINRPVLIVAVLVIAACAALHAQPTADTSSRVATMILGDHDERISAEPLTRQRRSEYTVESAAHTGSTTLTAVGTTRLDPSGHAHGALELRLLRHCAVTATITPPDDDHVRLVGAVCTFASNGEFGVAWADARGGGFGVFVRFIDTNARPCI